MGRAIRLIGRAILSPLVFVFAAVIGGAIGAWTFVRKEQEQYQEDAQAALVATDPEDEHDDEERHWLADLFPSERLEASHQQYQRQAAQVTPLTEPLEVWHAKKKAAQLAGR